MFCKSQQTPRRSISPMSKFIVHASPISTPTQTQKAPVSLPSHPVTHSAAARLSCPSPSTPSLASCRHSSVSSSSAHSLAAAASSGPKSRIFAYPTNWRPAGRHRGRRAPISRDSARLRLGLAVDSPAMGSPARPRHQGPLLAIPGHRLPARWPPRTSSGVFAESPDLIEPLDADVSAASACPAPTPQFSRTSSVDI
jgi:hypothetical protein